MMRRLAVVLMMAALVAAAGCVGLKPDVVTKSGNLEGEHIILMEQSDRMPKEVLLEAQRRIQVLRAQGATITPEIIAEVVAEIIKVFPQMAEVYAAERMANALVQRRILLKGYEGEELKDLQAIINELRRGIEYTTPQDRDEESVADEIERLRRDIEDASKVKAWDNPVPE